MKVIGHRGAAGLAPENTFAGFDLALALGVDGIETDVQKTKDGKLVLFHDYLLDRTTTGTGALQETLWQELQQLDAGSWFDSSYAGERIPLLLEALTRYGTRTYFDLEIKQVGIECEVLHLVEQLDLLDRVTFTSQDLPTAGCCNDAIGGQLTTLVISPLVKRGFQSTIPETHYSLLRTIEEVWGLPFLGEASKSTAMTEYFTSTGAASPPMTVI